MAFKSESWRELSVSTGPDDLGSGSFFEKKVMTDYPKIRKSFYLISASCGFGIRILTHNTEHFQILPFCLKAYSYKPQQNQ
jgi:hypothetical protein